MVDEVRHEARPRWADQVDSADERGSDEVGHTVELGASKKLPEIRIYFRVWKERKDLYQSREGCALSDERQSIQIRREKRQVFGRKSQE